MAFLRSMLCSVALLVVGAAASQAADKLFSATALGTQDIKKVAQLLRAQEAKFATPEELRKAPGFYWDEDLQKQSFKITSSQKGMDNVFFVPIYADFNKQTAGSATSKLSLLIIQRKDNEIMELPKHPALRWTIDEVVSVAFRDLRGDHQRSIIVNATAMTGVGENGAVPMDVYAVYLPTPDGKWALSDTLQEHLLKTKAGSVAAVVKAAKAFLAKKKI